MLLARRLVEAGVKLVTVCSGFNGKTPQDAWDTHTDNFRKLKNQLLPPLDRGLSALLDDLAQRGLVRRTLLVVMGEFGRTPRINKAAGRDHWHHCYSVLLTGGGVRAGRRPGPVGSRRRVSAAGPRLHARGSCARPSITVSASTSTREMTDHGGRPLPLTRGTPIRELF